MACERLLRGAFPVEPSMVMLPLVLRPVWPLREALRPFAMKSETLFMIATPAKPDEPSRLGSPSPAEAAVSPAPVREAVRLVELLFIVCKGGMWRGMCIGMLYVSLLTAIDGLGICREMSVFDEGHRLGGKEFDQSECHKQRQENVFGNMGRTCQSMDIKESINYDWRDNPSVAVFLHFISSIRISNCVFKFNQLY